MEESDQQSSHFMENFIEIQQPQQPKEICLSELMKSEPANEIINIERPHSMQARTIYKEIVIEHLPRVLQQPCVERVEQGQKMDKILPNFYNKSQLEINEYFSQQFFNCIYKKYKSNIISPERVKSISHILDYNPNVFKQIDSYHQSHLNLSIDSNFQNGNLSYCFTHKKRPCQYYMLLECDTNSHGVRNHKLGKASFHISNISKRTNNYKEGMLISIFSFKRYAEEGVQWFKGGDGINLTTTKFQRVTHPSKYYSNLSFSYTFKYESDQVYFAMHQPYTYTRLSNFITSNWHSNIDAVVDSIGYTLCNNIIPCITVGVGQNINKRKAIVLIGRQHPCESMSSYIIEHLMRLLNQYDNDFQYLLNRYQIVIFPMTNPDGVIHGNSRCNLAGFDLNRQWVDNCLKEFTPQTFLLKNYLEQLHRKVGIILSLDLHGHSKKLNSFIFSCKDSSDESNILSMLMAKIQPRFNLENCTFGRQKNNTFRKFIFELGIQFSYVLETSFYGFRNGELIIHYSEDDYYQIAKSLLKSVYCLIAEPEQCLKYKGFNRQTVFKQMKPKLDEIIKQQKYEKEIKQLESDSDPDGDLLDINERINVLCRNQKTLISKIQKIEMIRENRKNLKKETSQNKFNYQSQTFRLKLCKKNHQQIPPSISSVQRNFKMENIKKYKNYPRTAMLKKPCAIEHLIKQTQFMSDSMLANISSHYSLPVKNFDLGPCFSKEKKQVNIKQKQQKKNVFNKRSKTQYLNTKVKIVKDNSLLEKIQQQSNRLYKNSSCQQEHKKNILKSYISLQQLSNKKILQKQAKKNINIQKQLKIYSKNQIIRQKLIKNNILDIKSKNKYYKQQRQCLHNISQSLNKNTVLYHFNKV